jgi:hypothetical protein
MWYFLADLTNDEFKSERNKSYKYRRTYALDRISQIEETSNKFVLDNNFNPKEVLKNLKRLNYNQSVKAKKVIFEMSSTKAHLVENLPIHISQKNHKTEDNKTRFELFVIT